MNKIAWILLLGSLACRLTAATNVLVSGGVLRDAAGAPVPTGALVVLVASTVDNTFTPPPPGALLRVGDVIGGDDIVVATWAADPSITSIAGGAYRLVTFDYARMGMPNLGAGDRLMLYWFPAATLANPVATPNGAYGSYRTDAVSPRSNMNWTAPVDTNGATLALTMLTDTVGGDLASSVANASAVVGAATAAPIILAQPSGQTVPPGANVTFQVTAAGGAPLAYQWFKGVASIAGATTASLGLAGVQSADSATYSVVVSNASGNVTSLGAVLLVSSNPEIVRGLLAGTSRGQAGAASAVLSGAFTVEGTSGKQMLIRAVGPTLSTFNVSGALADPQLEIVHAATGAIVASNDDWANTIHAAQVTAISAQVGAYALGAGSKDAVVFATFAPGTYRARVLGANAGTGIAQLEIYDADSIPRLVYLAIKGRAGTGANALVQGFVAAALPAGRSYLIRALGPALGGVGALADPALAVYDFAGTQIAANNDWAGAAPLISIGTTVGAMALPAGSKDAALNFVPPAAGAYTVQVTGAGSATGLALLEIFESDTQRAALLPAAIVASPESVAVALGQPLSLSVVTVGKPAPTYQWRKNSAALAGATAPRLVVPTAQAGDAGVYDVVVVNSGGTATSAVATVTVNLFAEHNADTDRNFRIGLLELTRIIELYNTRFGTTRTGRYAVLAGTEDGFTSDPNTALATVVSLTRYHSADSDRDGRISLVELTRVIELYNYRNGSIRTGQYHVQAGTEDGYGPGP